MTDVPGGTAPPPSSAPPPYPPPPPGPPPRRLVRRGHGRMIFGVAAGLGDYFGIDPIVVRIVFVLLAFAGGAGVLLYVLAAILMPGDRGEDAPVAGMVRRIEQRRGQRWLGIVLVIVAVALIVDGASGFHAGIIWGLVLVVVGVMLFEGDWAPWSTAPEGGAEHVAPYAASPPVQAPPASSWSTPSWGGAPRDRGYAWPRRRRTGPPVGWITVALTLVAVGVAVMLGNAGAIRLTVGSSLAIALVVIGAGLLVTAFVGRGRWLLILLGLLLVPTVLTGAVVTEPFRGGAGQHVYAPISPDGVLRDYKLGAGQLTLDFTKAHLGATPFELHAEVTLGQLVVHLPPDLPVLINAGAGAGHLDLLGLTQDGFGLNNSEASPGTSPTESRLILDLDVGLGQILVDRDTSGATP